MASAALTVRELAQQMALEGHPLAQELADAVDAADDVYAIEYEFDDLAPDISLQDEARRLVTFEHRVRQLLIDWGAVDAGDPSPPDLIDILRMLLG